MRAHAHARNSSQVPTGHNFSVVCSLARCQESWAQHSGEAHLRTVQDQKVQPNSGSAIAWGSLGGGRCSPSASLALPHGGPSSEVVTALPIAPVPRMSS